VVALAVSVQVSMAVNTAETLGTNNRRGQGTWTDFEATSLDCSVSPDHRCPQGHPDLEPTITAADVRRIAHRGTWPTSRGAAGCSALTGRRLPDLRAARRTRDLCRRDSRLRSAMDLACTCDRPRVYLAGDPGTTVSTHRGPSRQRTTPAVSWAASAAIPLPAPSARCHAVYSHR
jgi:hypothetical protein